MARSAIAWIFVRTDSGLLASQPWRREAALNIQIWTTCLPDVHQARGRVRLGPSCRIGPGAGARSTDVVSHPQLSRPTFAGDCKGHRTYLWYE
ncbi:hypothetical protein DFH06DRAFT_1196466 [Mycena polygramma]|nr:hypothetical protein DFH06DRAFT_1196466 [Mycena polygramma]